MVASREPEGFEDFGMTMLVPEDARGLTPPSAPAPATVVTWKGDHIRDMLGHASLKTMLSSTKLSIQQLKLICQATHQDRGGDGTG